MKAYYQEGAIAIYHGATDDLLHGLPKHHFSVLVLDPPYTLTVESMYRFADWLVEKDLKVIFPQHLPCVQFGHPHSRSLTEMLNLLEPTTGAILDPYLGSGTTLVAAKRLGREAIGIEIEEKYCRATMERLRAA